MLVSLDVLFCWGLERRSFHADNVRRQRTSSKSIFSDSAAFDLTRNHPPFALLVVRYVGKVANLKTIFPAILLENEMYFEVCFIMKTSSNVEI